MTKTSNEWFSSLIRDTMNIQKFLFKLYWIKKFFLDLGNREINRSLWIIEDKNLIWDRIVRNKIWKLY